LPSPKSGEKPSSKATVGTSKATAAGRHAHAAMASTAANNLAVDAMARAGQVRLLVGCSRLDRAPSLSLSEENLTR
jgi:hypothetical protein